MVSASTLYSDESSLGLMMISKNIKRRVHCLLLFACSVKSHISEPRTD